MAATGRTGLLKFLIGFFAGVITTVCLLVPGRTGPTVLVNGDATVQSEQLAQTGIRVQELGRAAHERLRSATDYLENLFDERTTQAK